MFFINQIRIQIWTSTSCAWVLRKRREREIEIERKKENEKERKKERESERERKKENERKRERKIEKEREKERKRERERERERRESKNRRGNELWEKNERIRLKKVHMAIKARTDSQTHGRTDRVTQPFHSLLSQAINSGIQRGRGKGGVISPPPRAISGGGMWDKMWI